NAEQTVTLHPRYCLAHCGATLLKPFGDARPQRYDPFLLKVVNSAKVHLSGIDEIVHVGSPFSPNPDASPVDRQAISGWAVDFRISDRPRRSYERPSCIRSSALMIS